MNEKVTSRNLYTTESNKPLPHSDAWLVSPERTWDEINSCLESRLQGIQANFQSEETNFLKTAYGIEKPVDSATARTLAFAEITDEYSQGHVDYEGYSVDLRDEYEVEKAKIKNDRALKQGVKRKRIDQLWKTKFNPDIESASVRSKEFDSIKKLILKKATLDLISGSHESSPDVTPELLRIYRESRERFGTNPSAHEFFQERQPLDNFISSLGDFLNTTRDKNLFMRYDYRQTPGIISTRDDTRVLDTMLHLAIDEVYQDEPERKVFKDLGRGYFRFLSQRASSLSEQSSGSEYPYLSLLYDIYTVSHYHGKPSTISSAGSFIDEYLYSAVSNGTTQKEVKRFAENWAKVEHLIFDEEVKLARMLMDQHHGRVRISEAELFKFNSKNVSETRIDALTSIEERIGESFHHLAVSGATHSKTLGTLRRAYSEIVNRKSLEYVRRLGLKPAELKLVTMLITTSMPYVELGKNRGVEVDLRYITTTARIPEPAHMYSSEKTDKHSLLRENLAVIEKQYVENNSDLDLHLWRVYAEQQFATDPENVKKSEKENQFLWVEVLDNPIWFVSHPRGDRFSSRNDQELTEHMIESITFRTDRNRPREHAVTFVLNGYKKPLVFWLDTQRNLLSESNMILPIPPEFRESIMNLVLKRLYSITSGVLSSGVSEELSPGDESKVYEYKRAHYRKLTSTTERPVTMESYGAQMHAREVKEEYGIDIFEEIKRRRKVGTLNPNEFLTFVRESKPSSSGSLLKPNELTYNPNLLVLPI